MREESREKSEENGQVLLVWGWSKLCLDLFEFIAVGTSLSGHHDTTGKPRGHVTRVGSAVKACHESGNDPNIYPSKFVVYDSRGALTHGI